MTTRAVVVVDLGLGNLRSVARALERAGGAPRVSSSADEIRRAERLVVPGQGAFRDGAQALHGAEGLGDALRERIAAGTPYLGLCLGMQLLFAESDEAPGARGLGVLPGRVARLRSGMRDADGAALKVPHMGWNEVDGRHALLPARDWFYFVHSFACAPSDASLVVGTADYGDPICAAVARGPLFACQFHPEKSQDAGAHLLERFFTEAWWS